ncbi:hypothetical protein K503DRAFT_783535 [Rhizopogon vinicolor AM-OR11-026]|uniref:Uncharacterized protein n=1 Tax=Rhizopogon vinicolor AM-OR11-026 TaxID=1314800 RepID=A0A1B7MY76_9AGAM|nr:hypothetical protein K503DRAFT_783535 [Rhizopogon vinicolor AM-OR11-026]
MHYNALPHFRPLPPDLLRAQSNTRIHRRDYIISAHPLRRSHEHLDSARIVRNHTHIYNASRKTNDQDETNFGTRAESSQSGMMLRMWSSGQRILQSWIVCMRKMGRRDEQDRGRYTEWYNSGAHRRLTLAGQDGMKQSESSFTETHLDHTNMVKLEM